MTSFDVLYSRNRTEQNMSLLWHRANHVWGTGRPWRYNQHRHRRTAYYHRLLCRWHSCKCRTGISWTTMKVLSASASEDGLLPSSACRWHSCKCRRGRSWSSQPPQDTTWRFVVTRRKWWQTFALTRQKWWQTTQWRTASTWDQSSLVKDPNPKFFSGLSRQQQLFLDWRPYEGTGTCCNCLLLKLSWCRR